MSDDRLDAIRARHAVGDDSKADADISALMAEVDRQAKEIERLRVHHRNFVGLVYDDMRSIQEPDND